MNTTTCAVKRRFRFTSVSLAALATLSLVGVANAQTTQYFAGDGSALNASKYSSNSSGPFTNAFASGSIIGFGVANGTGVGPTAAITIGGITATQNFTLTATGSTLSAASQIAVNVGNGFTVDLGSNGFISVSATGGYALTGGGTFATTGNTFGGGVTLGGGSTLVARGVNALGSTSTNTLTLNSGILASSKTNDYSGKFAAGITVGGDFQLGILSANSPTNGAGTALIGSDTYNQTFSDKIALGTATTRTITLGNRGTQSLGGVISGSSGLTFAAVGGAESAVSSNGVIALTNTANTFTGAININGPEVTFAGDGSLGNTANTINIDGGRFTVTASSTITAGRGIQIGSTAGTSISAKGSMTIITYNGVIADKVGSTGSFAKQGGGTLALGGVSSYSGDTSINNGTLQLTTGNNRLPTGTTVNIGQAASTNVGTFDLNGFSQQIAGLNSTTGASGATAKNTVTSSTAATLTLGGGGTYAYGDGTATNSGIITGAISILKAGSGTQTFGDANTYTGTTTVNAGTLKLDSAGSTTARLANTTGITLNNGGALLLANSSAIASTDRINNGAGVTISGGGTLQTGGLSEGTRPTAPAGGTAGAAGAGALTLQTTTASLHAIIDFGTGANGSSLVFTSLSGASGAYVDLLNFSGTAGSDGGISGNDRLLFSANPNLTTSDLANFAFYDDSNAPFAVGGAVIAYGNEFEIVPVPEPTTILGGLLLVGAASWSQRRRLRSAWIGLRRSPRTA